MLVGGLEHVFFQSVGNVIIPADEIIFFRGVGQPPTSHDSSLPGVSDTLEGAGRTEQLL
jgi:hypothetical protein